MYIFFTGVDIHEILSWLDLTVTVFSEFRIGHQMALYAKNNKIIIIIIILKKH